MTRRVVLRPEVYDDLRDARDWYKARRAGLGLEFVEECFAVIESLETSAHRHRRIDDGIRRVLLTRFPYAVYYALTDESVVVLAVFHGHRRPGAWRKRD